MVQVVEADNVNLVVQETLLQQIPPKEILVEMLPLLLVVEVEVRVVLVFQETQLVMNQKAGTGSSLESYLSTFGGAISSATPAGVLSVIAGGGGGGNPSPNNVGFGGGSPGGRPGSANACAALGSSGGGGGGGGPGYPPGACSQGGNGGSGVVAIEEKGSVTSVSGMWSMQEQYAESLADNWTPTSTPFGNVNILTLGAGGGGSRGTGGGGGAGGYQWNSSLTLGTNNSYTAQIGAGGIGSQDCNTGCAGKGNVTIFSGPDIQTITIPGGGIGGFNSAAPINAGVASQGYGQPGSSGGGGGTGGAIPAPTRPGLGGDGNTPALFMASGNPGGNGLAHDNSGGGGGGGAGGAGGNATGSTGGGASSDGRGGTGGAGATTWPGDCTARASGGAGSSGHAAPALQPATPGGGGAGGIACTTSGTSGTANTGGGGGAGGGGIWTPGPSGSGGSGVIIIQYPGAQRAAGGTISCVSCKTQHIMANTGSFLTQNPGGSAVTLDYLLIAGGGGGGGTYGGGGGAGGYITSYSTPPVSATTLWEGSSYNVTVGSGGAGGSGKPAPEPSKRGLNGSPSTIGILAAIGGGGGGAELPAPARTPSNKQQPGGSGGGSSYNACTFMREGGLAINGGAQGYDGGDGHPAGSSLCICRWRRRWSSGSRLSHYEWTCWWSWSNKLYYRIPCSKSRWRRRWGK